MSDEERRASIVEHAIPLTIECTQNGAKTEGMLVGVLTDDLHWLADDLAAAEARVAALGWVAEAARRFTSDEPVIRGALPASSYRALCAALAALDGQQGGA